MTPVAAWGEQAGQPLGTPFPLHLVHVCMCVRTYYHMEHLQWLEVKRYVREQSKAHGALKGEGNEKGRRRKVSLPCQRGPQTASESLVAKEKWEHPWETGIALGGSPALP